MSFLDWKLVHLSHGWVTNYYLNQRSPSSPRHENVSTDWWTASMPSNNKLLFVWMLTKIFGNIRHSAAMSLTHWGQVTHICVGTNTNIGSDNGLSPGRRQAIIWTNAGILLIGPLRTNLSWILSEIHTFHSRKCILKHRLRSSSHLVSASTC